MDKQDIDKQDIDTQDIETQDIDTQDIDNMSDNIEESNQKIMSMLSSMFMMNSVNNDTNNLGDNVLEYDDSDKDFYSKIDNLVETSNLIYDESCSITISTEQVKDEIDIIKNNIVIINNNIDYLKNKLQELIDLVVKISSN